MTEFTVVMNGSPLRFPPCGVRVYTDALLQALRATPFGARVSCLDFTLSHPLANRAGQIVHRLIGERCYLALKTGIARWKAKTFDLPHFGRTAIYHETNTIPPTDVPLPYVTTVHDLSVLRFPAYHPSYRVTFFAEHFERTLRSTKITVPSQATKRDLQQEFGVSGEKIAVIPYGKDVIFQPMDLQEATTVAKQYVNMPFVLYCGVIEPRKNLENLMLAFRRVRRSSPIALVLAGSFGWHHTPLLRLPRRLGLTDAVFTGQISSEHLRALYNCTEVFVYPSWYEGFGLPPLEAMACGAPVVLSRTSSLPEVGGDAAVYVDPNNPENIAAGILQVLDDGELRQTLRQRGLARAQQFSWRDTATRMIALYTQLAQQSLS